MQFELLTTDGAARRGRLAFPRGTIETPAFMPVGTAASVKGLAPWELERLAPEMVLANTYHLLIRPGVEVVEASVGDSADLARLLRGVDAVVNQPVSAFTLDEPPWMTVVTSSK